MSIPVYQGFVKSWIEHLGFGYVSIDGKFEDDIFIGRSHVPARNKKRYLKPGEPVSFQLDLRGRTLRAVNLRFDDAEQRRSQAAATD